MGLSFIDNQPWIFQDRNEYQTCQKDEPVCNLIADGDEVFFQFKNDPCGASLLCDTDFSGEGGDVISNGAFESSGAGWTFAGPEWAYNAGGYMDVVTVGTQPLLSQSISGGINDGNCYIVRYTILNYVSGSITPILAGTSGTPVSADGTYSEVFTAGIVDELLSFSPDVNSEMSITDIQLYDMGACWCPDNGNLYHPPTGTNMMCHIPGAETVLTQVNTIPPIVNGKYYKIQITISGSTAGTVHYIVGAAAVSTDFSGNGSFTDYVFADGDDNFAIVFSSDFDGCVTDILVYEMTTDIDFGVVQLNESAVQELSAYLTFVDNYVFVNFDTSAFSFDHGCYRLVVGDPCSMEFYYSNCFNWQASFPDTRQVIAIDRVSTDPSSRYSFGFYWLSTNFYLVQRVGLNFRRPSKETKFSDDRFSTGSRFKSYAEQSKKWELAIEHLDETKHDCMALQWQCKSVSIDGVEYFTQDEEYNPLWDDNNYLPYADVKINVTRKQDVIFADNCNR